MNTLTKTTENTHATKEKKFYSIIAVFIYRVMEQINGEKGFKLVPYRISQNIKMKALNSII